MRLTKAGVKIETKRKKKKKMIGKEGGKKRSKGIDREKSAEYYEVTVTESGIVFELKRCL